jgi:hypothetical protein
VKPPPKSEREPTMMPIGTPEGIKKRQIITRDDVGNLKTLRADGATRVLVPEDDPRYERALAGRKCGVCRHFNLAEGQKSIREQRFIERMMQDERWRSEWFNKWEEYGMCDHFDGRLVWANHQAVVAGSDVDSTKAVGSQAGMEMIDCPYFSSKDGRGDKMIMSRSGKRTWNY